MEGYGKHDGWYRCKGCAAWLHEDEVIWARQSGKLDTRNGLPWCSVCFPEEVPENTAWVKED